LVLPSEHFTSEIKPKELGENGHPRHCGTDWTSANKRHIKQYLHTEK